MNEKIRPVIEYPPSLQAGTITPDKTWQKSELEKVNKARSWDKLVAFLSDDSDLTTEQIKEDLIAQGVDVEAFLKRVKATVEKFK